MTNLSKLIDQLYDAAIEPALWPQVVDAAADLFESPTANLSHHDWETHDSVNISPRVDGSYHRSYEQYYAARNPLVRTAASLGVGAVFITSNLVPRKQLIRTEIYADWFAPQGMDYGMGINLGVDGTRGTAFAIWRPLHQEPFQSEDRAMLASLVPHLRRALKISRHLAEANTLGASTAAAWDRFTHGIALLDHRGHVRFLNLLAEELVAARDGLDVRGGLLVATSPKQATALRNAIQEVIDTGRGSSLRLRRTSDKRALTLLFAPLKADSPWLAASAPAVLIVITDPDRGCVAPKQRLVETYRLTATEASVVMRLLQGEGLKAIAKEKHISYETARTHLRRVLGKTGTHRQSDLVRLLVREVGILR